MLFPLWDPDIVEDREKQKRVAGPLNNTMKQKKSARRDEVVQAATDNRELVVLFFFTFLLFQEDMTGGLGARRWNKKSGERS